MKLINLLVCILFVLFSASAAAQFYKYVDEEGNTRFTDDINLVPVDQRKNIESYTESYSETEAEEKTANQEAAQAAPELPDSVKLSGNLDEEIRKMPATVWQLSNWKLTRSTTS